MFKIAVILILALSFLSACGQDHEKTEVGPQQQTEQPLNTQTATISKNSEKTSDINQSDSTGTFDTFNLRHDADFSVPVATRVRWVPVNTLGRSNLSNENISEMINLTEDEKQEKITNLYEAVQLFQICGFTGFSGSHIRTPVDSITWEFHFPGKKAVEVNGGDCSASASWLLYILKDDYDEVGIIGYTQESGNGHVFNYIKQNDRYYIIDMTHYRIDFNSGSSVESGNLSDYKSSDFIAGNLHMVEDLNYYVRYCRQMYSNPPELIFKMTVDTESTVPAATKKSDGVVTRYISKDEPIDILYIDDENIKLEYVPMPPYTPDWSKFRSRGFKSNLPFD